MRLNLGCGKKRFEGYVSVDFPGTLPKPDVECDIRDLPYKSGTIDEIICIHALEHLYRHEAILALKHWVDLLKPGGKLIIEVPCLEKIVDNIRHGLTAQLTTWGLYGEQREIEQGNHLMQHKWCWSGRELELAIFDAGCKSVAQRAVKFHQPIRDMRVEGTK